jgi:hypothetical protein
MARFSGLAGEGTTRGGEREDFIGLKSHLQKCSGAMNFPPG